LHIETLSESWIAIRASGHLVHFPGGLEDQQAQHLALGGQFHQRELDGLVGGERLAERLALVGRSGRFPRRRRWLRPGRGGLADAVLVHEVLGKREAASGGPSTASSGTQTLVKLTRGWSVGMLKVHRYSSMIHAGRHAPGPGSR
jgi:hypothetical protein